MKSMLKWLWKNVTMVHETLSHYLSQRNRNGQEFKPRSEQCEVKSPPPLIRFDPYSPCSSHKPNSNSFHLIM